MAISLSNNPLLFQSENCLSTPSPLISRTKSIDFATRSSTPAITIPRVLSPPNESLSSIITELEKEETLQEQEFLSSYSATHSKRESRRKLANVWREIHGQDDWVGLLDPVDPLLRSELIRYGEMAQACYDAFDYDPYSKYCGSCRFVRRRFFESLGMTHHGYEVTRYLYAVNNINLPNFFKRSRWPKMWSNKANWIGYVAVSNDETTKRLGRRDITIAWRGTVTRLEWIADLMDFLKPVNGNKIPWLHLMQDGRALPVCVFSYSGPRVGNVRFKERIESLGVKVLRVVNVHDVVPKAPGFLFNEQVPPMLMKLAEGLPWCYSHIGVELALDHKNSPFLKDTVDPVCAHNLEAHLHLLDGYHGKGQRFVLASGRDPALVNKASDFLKDHYLVPPFWRQDENKGMIMNNDGRWVQPERPKLDDHPSDMHHHLKKLGLSSSEC
ncbi:triacylglycerol lipase, putative [Ricinus communis]|uniref:Triacylglycerol lipase, putative n=1 Tax=Ricinus communis TaxID=3988 RepID=B9S4S6_RICCO|nr:triacylglycerol lipase, putative [Ricinus communis]